MGDEVSIVIPVYQRAGIVNRTLDSVAAQTYRPLRLIVVDNNSDDGTPERVREWMAQHACDEGLTSELLHESKRGASAARNKGLQSVQSRHVIFFDSDDEMLPTLVEDAVKAIGDADLVYWQAELIGLGGERTLKPYHEGHLLFRQMYNSMLATQIYMARTDFIRGIGGWNEDALTWNDWELGIRIALAGPRTVVLPKILVRIHAQQDSITGRLFSERVGSREATLDMIERMVAGRRDEKILIDMLDYRRVILAATYRKEGAAEAACSLLKRTLKQRGRDVFSASLLRLLYYYTVAGGRAAYYLWGIKEYLRGR